MSEATETETIVPPDPVEQAMKEMRAKAITLIAKIDPVMLDRIHTIIQGSPSMVAAATVSAVLADILADASKTEDGLGRNVLITSEMVLKVATAGLNKKNEAAKVAPSIIH